MAARSAQPTELDVLRFRTNAASAFLATVNEVNERPDLKQNKGIHEAFLETTKPFQPSFILSSLYNAIVFFQSLDIPKSLGPSFIQLSSLQISPVSRRLQRLSSAI